MSPIRTTRSHLHATCATILCIVALALPAATLAKPPATDLLGLRLGMDDRQVRERLARNGKLLTKAESPKQTWGVRDRRYESVVIRFDSKWHLQWVTAFARPKGSKVRYRDIGDLRTAHRSGTYIYTWTLPAAANGARVAITARGTDPDYVSSVSLHPPGPASPP